jgi:regulator of replication initiation timing
MDIISTISTSIALAQRLREISKNVADAEFKNLLADLSSELADLKLEAAALKERIASLQEENALLKQTASPADEGPIGRRYGCYQFCGDDGLYCPACWDSKRKKSTTTRINTKFRLCSVCQAPLGSG